MHYTVTRHSSSEPLWRLPRHLLRDAIPDTLRPWLLDDGSLTRRLQRTCGQGFHVELLRQYHGRPQANEARALGLPCRIQVLIREVRLKCGIKTWVFARTLIPLTTLSGKERRLAHLGTRSLGSVLFQDRNLHRGELEVTRLLPGQELYHLACMDASRPPPEIWGRRSLFHLQGKSLLVSEIFLPGVGRPES